MVLFFAPKGHAAPGPASATHAPATGAEVTTEAH